MKIEWKVRRPKPLPTREPDLIFPETEDLMSMRVWFEEKTYHIIESNHIVDDENLFDSWLINELLDGYDNVYDLWSSMYKEWLLNKQFIEVLEDVLTED